MPHLHMQISPTSENNQKRDPFLVSSISKEGYSTYNGFQFHFIFLNSSLNFLLYKVDNLLSFVTDNKKEFKKNKQVNNISRAENL